MKVYDDRVEVRRGWIPGVAAEGPDQFLWRGRLWKVRAVLAHWVATGPGRSRPATDDAGPAAGDLPIPQEFWRVEAGRGMSARLGADGDEVRVFDLSCNVADGRWQLVGCSD